MFHLFSHNLLYIKMLYMVSPTKNVHITAIFDVTLHANALSARAGQG